MLQTESTDTTEEFTTQDLVRNETAPKSVSESRAGWRWVGLIGITAVAAGLRFWRLDQNGHGNVYYAAAVRSMLVSFSNFFFGAFDPVGFVTVDKPPGAIWIQAVSAKLLGYHGISLLLPQALLGVASVVLVYHLVRRVFGTGAGLLAGLILAVTPICVAVDRDNLPDSALVFVLLLAGWALSIAAETGRLKPLLLSAALVGLGFNIKMLAAFVVLPTFYLCYLVGARINWKARVLHLAAATLVLVALSLSWSFAVELTPKSRRPYIGGSRNNSALDLALGYNGIGRVFGGRGNMGPPGPGAMPKAAPRAEDRDDVPTLATGSTGDDPLSGGAPGSGLPPFGAGNPFPGGMPPMFGGTPGVLRFTAPLMAGQITWLFPIAILGAIVAASRVRRQWPFNARDLSLLLWTGWLGTHWLVFSFARGIFHEYYTTIMGPAVAALAGIGTVALYHQWREGGGRGYLPTALILTAAWEAYIISQFPELRRWLLPALGLGTVVSVIGLLGASRLSTRRSSIASAVMATAIGMSAILVGPVAWSVGTIIVPGNSMMPAATPAALTGGRDRGIGIMPMPPFGREMEDNDRLIALLQANHHGERIWLAAPASMEVGPIIVKTGVNAVSLGGFMGADPVVDPEQFSQMVEDREVRFVMIGGGPGGGMPPPPGGMPFGPPGGPPRGMQFPPGGPGGPGRSEVMAWVREHGTEVDPALWKSPVEPDDAEPEGEEGGSPPGGMRAFFRQMRGMSKLYDCKPELGLINPAEISR